MLIKWNEPLFSKGGDTLGNSVVSATKEDFIRWCMEVGRELLSDSDEEIFLDFEAVNWSWTEHIQGGYFVSGPETSFVVYEHKDIEPFLTSLYMSGMIDDKNEYTATKISFEYKDVI